MLRRPDYSMAKFMGNWGGSLIPRLVGNVDPDDDLREVRGFLDGIKARVPGYSDTLPPVRNALGEPVMKSEPSWSPIRATTTPDDTVAQELAQYNRGLPTAPRRLEGMDLTQFQNDKGQDAQDRLKELIGQTQINGNTLRDSLGKLFGSQEYQQAPPVSDPNDITNPRVRAVQTLFYRFHQAAQSQLLKEYPQIGALFQSMQQARTKATNSNIQGVLQYGQ